MSAYLDRDHERVASRYAELFVDDTCPWVSEFKKIVPGSKTRKDIALPGPTTAGGRYVVLEQRWRYADEGEFGASKAAIVRDRTARRCE